MRFKGKVAIVTGAGQGIGRETARMFVEEGAIVVMNDINGELVRRASAAIAGAGQAVPFVADVRKPNQVNGMVEQVAAKYGHIDILVNNVGHVLGAGVTIEEATLETWQQTIDWNLTSQFLCCRAVVSIMEEQRYGRIVNVSTDAAFRGTLTDDIAYPAAKAGVIGLTRELARYLGRYGITANVVAPGDTMTAGFYRTIEQGLWPETLEELLERHTTYTPVGRPAEPHEIASCILFLASDDASYITGETIMVTGGFHLTNIPAGGKAVRMSASCA